MIETSKDSSALEVQLSGHRVHPTKESENSKYLCFKASKDSKTQVMQRVHGGRDCKRPMELFQL